MTSQTVIDTDNRYGWAERQRVFDEDGFLFQEILIFDDGRTKTTTLVDGVVINVALNDPLDAAIWTIRTTSYNETTGLIVGSSTSYDDGRSIVETCTDGIRATRTTTDRENAFTWTSQVATYDTLGLLSQRTTTFDDGRIATSSYTSNVVTTRTIVDSADAYNWAERVYTFDPATGQRLSRRTEYDTGIIETQTDLLGPLNGTRAREDTLDRFNWHSITDTFDAVGLLSQRVRVNDDGVTQTTTYSAGQPQTATWVDVDDTKAWATRTGTYDAAGRLASLRITFDDGHVSQRTYTDGALTRRIDGDVSDAFDWHTRDFSYDTNGQIIVSSITADDGTLALRFYTDGILTSIQRHDAGENIGWSTIKKKYSPTGIHLHTTRTEDDGSFTTRDARGLEVFEGTSDTVVEDSAITLAASGAVTFVDGYRGSQTFNGFQNVTGLAGLGSFTVTNDGTWTYTAINNQFDVQTLNAGETLTDSIIVTTQDMAEVLLSVTIEGQDETTAAPVFLGSYTPLIGTLGNLSTPLSFDLGNLFSDDQGEDLTIAVGTIPAGFAVIDGVITAVDPTDFTLVSPFATSLTATDSAGLTTTVEVILNLGIQHDFGDNFIGAIPRAAISSPADDVLVFGEDAFHASGSVFLYLGEGNNAVQFGGNAVQSGSRVFLETGGGNDTFSFDADAAQLSGLLQLDAGLGDNTAVFGNSAGVNSRYVSWASGSGADDLTFGNFAGALGGYVYVFTGSGDDVITFGDETGTDAGSVSVYGDSGNDRIIFGNNTGINTSRFLVNGGEGHDYIEFGQNTDTAPSSSTSLYELYGGSGDDTVDFGDRAGVSRADLGAGDDTLTFGEGSWGAVYMGTGADVVTFRENADDVWVDIGTDTDSDQLILSDTPRILSVRSFDVARDSIVLPIDETLFWKFTPDDVFLSYEWRSNEGHRITVDSFSQLTAEQIFPGLTLNRAPEFIGADADLGLFGVGNTAAETSIDISALFADQDIIDGLVDALTFYTRSLPSFMRFDGTTLTIANQTDMSNVGFHSATFVADDFFFSETVQTFNFEVGLHNDYGNFAPIVFETERVNGSAFSDVLTVGTVDFNFDEIASEFLLDAGARNDVIIVGAVNMASDFSVFEIDGGTGDDEITIASFSTTGTLTNQTVTGGSGADTITFVGDVQGLTIDLGADSDADTLTFGGNVTDVTIQNWVTGDDTVDVDTVSGWSITLDDGTNTTLGDGTSTLTFDGITGLTDTADVLI